MSMPPDKIVVDELWSFTITKDAENSVLLEFDNFDRTNKAALSAFLMAMLIKQHLKTIKAETGKKFKKFGFIVLKQFSGEEKKRIYDQLEEACKLLKIERVSAF